MWKLPYHKLAFAEKDIIALPLLVGLWSFNFLISHVVNLYIYDFYNIIANDVKAHKSAQYSNLTAPSLTI